MSHLDRLVQAERQNMAPPADARARNREAIDAALAALPHGPPHSSKLASRPRWFGRHLLLLPVLLTLGTQPEASVATAPSRELASPLPATSPTLPLVEPAGGPTHSPPKPPANEQDLATPELEIAAAELDLAAPGPRIAAPVVKRRSSHEQRATRAEHEREHAAPSAPSDAEVDTFAAELELLVDAKAALDAGDHPAARELLKHHRATYPRGVFAVEAEAMLVVSRCLSARDPDERARERARYLERRPNSPFAVRVREACAEAPS